MGGVVDITKWGSRWCCYYCRVLDRDNPPRVAATVRAFAGEMHSGEGFPACDRHAAKAISEAMATLGETKFINHAKWRVTVYVVEPDDLGYPRMTRQLFTARRKIAA